MLTGICRGLRGGVICERCCRGQAGWWRRVCPFVQNRPRKIYPYQRVSHQAEDDNSSARHDEAANASTCSREDQRGIFFFTTTPQQRQPSTQLIRSIPQQSRGMHLSGSQEQQGKMCWRHSPMLEAASPTTTRAALAAARLRMPCATFLNSRRRYILQATPVAQFDSNKGAAWCLVLLHSCCLTTCPAGGILQA